MKLRDPYKEYAKNLFEEAQDIGKMFKTPVDGAAQQKHNEITAKSLYFISTLLVDLRNIALLLLGSLLYQMIGKLFGS